MRGEIVICEQCGRQVPRKQGMDSIYFSTQRTDDSPLNRPEPLHADVCGSVCALKLVAAHIDKTRRARTANNVILVNA